MGVILPKKKKKKIPQTRHKHFLGTITSSVESVEYRVRAFIAMKLNSYIAILVSPKHKKCSALMYVKLKNFSFKLPYEATFGFIRKVKLKL